MRSRRGLASDLFGGSALSGRLLQHLELVGLEQGLHLLQHDVQQEGATPRLLNRVIVNNVYSLSLHLLQHDVQQEGAPPRLLNRVIVNIVYSLGLHLLQYDVQEGAPPGLLNRVMVNILDSTFYM